MRSMCLSSRCDATKLRPIPPKIQRFKASYVSLSSLWFFFFFVRPLPHPIPKDRQVNDSTLSQRVNATEIHTQPKHEKHCESQPVKATKLQRNRRPHGAHRFCWIAYFGRSCLFVGIAPVSGKHDFCGFVFLLDCTCIWNARLLLSWFFLMV